ncbi:MAG: DUF1761 domain-containing protein [candidate division Zixibacteria bacterium]|nr:DUF1761 domain-containing protein [candidate division Zixibacteria bacterium]
MQKITPFMEGINYWAVVVSALAAFVVGAVWYSPLLFGKAYLELRGIVPGAVADITPSAAELLGEFVRNFVIAFVLAHFLVGLGFDNWKGAMQLGLWVWVGFQAMMLLGALLHERMPLMLYAIHAGDALLKTLLMAAILALWRR